MGKPEAYVEDYLLKKANERKFLCYKFISGVNGVPDRIIIGNGYTVFVETKRLNGAPRKLQEAIIKKMRKQGAYVYVIDNRPDVDALLENMQTGRLEPAPSDT